MRLLLVRHGQTHSNVGRALDTSYPGAELTGLGHQQAARLASGLAGEPIDVVAASTLLRARQTAAPVAEARGLAVMVLEGLREIGAGDLEMRSDRDSIDTYRAVMVSWATGDLDVQVPGGVSGHEFLRRFDEAVQAIEEAATGACAQAQAVPTAVAVSHGAAIRTWAAVRCDGADAETARGNLVNTGMLIVEGSAGTGWRLERRVDPVEDPSPLPAS
jgi:broad specificity phosphatase PhoE